jgi:hypothetical protein
VSKDSHDIWNQVIAGVILIVITGVLGVVTGWLVKLFTWLGSVFQYFWGLVQQLWGILQQTVTIPIWLLVVILIPVVYVVVKLGRAFLKPRQPTTSLSQGPNVDDYTTDMFFGIKWRWVMNNGRFSLPTAFCPLDDTRLVRGEYSAFACRPVSENTENLRMLDQ